MILDIVIIVLMLLCSAFFSASETSFATVNQLRLKSASESGDKRAGRALYIRERFDTALSAILIGNNLANTAATSSATVVAITLMGPQGAGVASVAMTILLLLFGEISPKVVAKQRSFSLSRALSLPLQLIMFVLSPVGRAVSYLVDRITGALFKGAKEEPTITEEEFAAILDTVEDEGAIDEERSELLQSALEFDDITVQQVMTPRIEMAAIDIEDSLEEIASLVTSTMFSRIPVYEDTVDNIIGILYSSHFLKSMALTGTADVRGMLLKPLYMHKTMKLDDALKKFQKSHMHAAIVVDEFGGTLGMVTMEDLLEQLVGEIWDESDDVVNECECLGEGRYKCSGMLSMHEFFDAIDYEIRDFSSEYTTLGGWAIEMLDAQPAEGKSFTYDRLHVTVLKMDGLRVDQLLVELEPEAGEEEQ